MVTTLNWFELPAKDFKRATDFYAKVLEAKIQIDPNPNMQYAYLPSDPQKGGFGGAIGWGELCSCNDRNDHLLGWRK